MCWDAPCFSARIPCMPRAVMSRLLKPWMAVRHILQRLFACIRNVSHSVAHTCASICNHSNLRTTAQLKPSCACQRRCNGNTYMGGGHILGWRCSCLSAGCWCLFSLPKPLFSMRACRSSDQFATPSWSEPAVHTAGCSSRW